MRKKSSGKNENKKTRDGKYFEVKNQVLKGKRLPFSILVKWNHIDVYQSVDRSLTNVDFSKYFSARFIDCTLRNLGTNNAYGALPVDTELALLAVILKNHIEKIKHFETYCIDFENSYLNSNFSSCSNIISKMRNEIGYSKWLLENEFLVHSFQGVDFQKKLLKDITEDLLIDSKIKSLSYFYSLKVEEAISWHGYHENHVAPILQKSINRKQLDNRGMQFYEYNISNFENEDLVDVESLIWFERKFSVFDMYLCFLKIGTIIFLRGSENKTFKVYKDLLSELKYSFSGTRMSRLAEIYGLNEINLSDKDVSFVSALDDYTMGNYNSEKILSFINLSKGHDLEVCELIARCKLGENNSSSFGPYTKQYTDIVHKNDNLGESYDLLLKTALKLLGTGVSSQILSFIDRESNGTKGNNPSFNDLYSYVINGNFNPRIIKIINQVNFSPSSMKQLNISISMRLFESVKNKNLLNIKDLIPSYRYLKYEGVVSFNNKDYENAALYFEQSLVLSRDIDRFSLLRYLALTYLNLDYWEKCLDLTVVESLKNPAVISILPIPLLTERLQKESVFERVNALNAAIVYDLCIKHYISKKDYEEGRAFSYEDFLTESDLIKPSNISDADTLLFGIKIIYFLESICTQYIMDISEHFKSSHDLLQERILVLTLLAKINPNNSKAYQNEIKDCTLELLVGKRVQESEMGKIRINEVGVLSEITKNISEDYRRYTNLKSVIHYKSNEVSKMVFEIFLPGNESMLILKGILEKSKDAFLFSVNGLDANLSIDIRHGTFANVLKRSLKEYRLMVLFQNQYIDYSAINFNDLDSSQKLILSEVLLTLTKKLNILVNYFIRNIIQVKDERNKKAGKFDIRISPLDLIQIRAKIDSASGVEEIATFVINNFWEKIDNCLITVRQSLEVNASRSLNRIFNIAISSLEKSGEFNGKDQLRSLKLSQTEALNDLNRVIKWFNRAEVIEIDDFEVSLIPEIAKKTVENYFPGWLLNLVINNSNTQKIRGSELRDLVTILVICFTNAVTHSKLKNSELVLNVSLKKLGQLLVIEVDNNLNTEINLKELSTKMDVLKIEIKDKNRTNYVRAEGGSGIHKIVKILKNEFKGPDGLIDFGVEKKMFYIKMEIGVQYV